MAIISDTPSFDGTEESDIIRILEGEAGTVNVIDGFNIVIGFFGDVTFDYGTSFDTAFNLDADPSLWYDDSVRENPLVFDDNVPHLTALIDPEIGDQVYFQIVIPAGETLTVDIDSAGSFTRGPNTRLDLFAGDDLINAVAVSGGSLPTDGGFGSTGGGRTDDPFLTYQNTTDISQTYFINISDQDSFNGNFREDSRDSFQFIVNVSLTNHEVAGTVGESSSGTRINGGEGEDSLFGGENDDLFGFDGRDTLVGGSGANYIEGGAEFDAIYGRGGDDTILGQTGNDRIFGGDGDDIIFGGEGFDNIDGGDGDDTIFGGGINDTIIGGTGADTLIGGSGDDEFLYLSPDDLVSGEMINGGDGFDDILIRGSFGDIFDFRGVEIVSIEEIDIRAEDESRSQASIQTVQFSGSQVQFDLSTNLRVFGDFDSVGIGRVERIEIFMDNSGVLDVSNWQISGFTRPTETISIFGTSGSDTILGSDVKDRIFGEAGDDVFIGSAGRDLYDGGNGYDILSYENASSGINASLASGAGTRGDANGDTFANIEELVGSMFNDVLLGRNGTNDTIRGGDGNDIVSGNGGDDILFGDGGNDTLIAGFGADQHDGGDGSDTIDFSAANTGVIVNLNSGRGILGQADGDTYTDIENVTGTGLADYIEGTTDDNVLSGGGGDDVIEGRGGADQFNGGAGFDTVSYSTASSGVSATLFLGLGTAGDAAGDTFTDIEALIGSAFNDELQGRDNAVDMLSGGGGNDVLRGHGGDDIVFGEGGDDIFISGFGSDNHNGGLGSDTIDYGLAGAGVIANLNAGTGLLDHAQGDTYVNIENIIGTAFGDLIVGDAGANVLQGQGARDVIQGRDGNDTINGGTGNDVLNGGTGADRFIFADGDGSDRLEDFNQGENDLIDLSGHGLTSFAQVQALLLSSGNDVVIDFGGGDAVRLVDININDLSASDFILATPPASKPVSADAEDALPIEQEALTVFLTETSDYIAEPDLGEDTPWAILLPDDIPIDWG